MKDLKGSLSVAAWVAGNVAACGLAAGSLVLVVQMAYSAWNVWVAILVLCVWPVSLVVGPIAAVFAGAWLPLLLLVLAALAAFLGWLLCLLIGWN